jgi:hypothetical protein
MFMHRRSLVRWLSALGVTSLTAFGLAFGGPPPTQAQTSFSVETINGIAGSEIVDVSYGNKFAAFVGKGDSAYRLRIVNLNTKEFIQPSVDIQATYPASALGLTSPRSSSVAFGPGPNPFVIVTMREEAEVTTAKGKAVFVDINPSTGLGTVRPNTLVELGVNPESIDISLDGRFAVVSNQGNPGDPANPGTITVIDLRSTPFQTQTITPIVPNVAVPSPETVAISRDSRRAYVTLQDDNAITSLVVDAERTPLRVEARTVIPNQFGTPALRPDGIAVSPDSNYVVTANEKANPRTVSLFRADDNANLTLINTIPTPNTNGAPAFGFTPEMATTGEIGGQVKAFFSFQQDNALGVYNITPQGLVYDTSIPLNVAGQPTATGPEGVAFADDLNMIVAANSVTRNVSLVTATNIAPPSPTPSLPADRSKVYFPRIQK